MSIASAGPRTESLQTPEPALTAACRRISADFPTAPDAMVEELMLTAYGRTCDARIETFRVMLAERDTRSRLRRSHRSRHSHTGGLPSGGRYR